MSAVVYHCEKCLNHATKAGKCPRCAKPLSRARIAVKDDKKK